MKRATALMGAVFAAILVVSIPASAQTTPTVTLTPGPASGYMDMQIITVSVGANSFFQPNTAIKVLECAVGSTSDATCDGNTINADEIVVKSDGSFSDSDYEMWLLPSATLAEPPSNQPKCNATTQCVLYVGENQNDFTQPHVFSAPFVISPANVTTTTNPSPTVPETAYAPLLPLGAALVIGCGIFVMRRRNARTASPGA